MENEYIHMLARVVLPSQILNCFSVVGGEETETEIYISLDEKTDAGLSEDVNSKSKGFMEAASVPDLPIRDLCVVIKVLTNLK